ncbi:sulfite exporter TauE/SafE family protein [Winogradskyella litorisediminis]|uniref:Sulfite exporter TauE/SafE family protein n=1 Tax=Winogradskyella litorisediminis TaxID=1156618 RepID=A0ABW3NBJ0_9FLAO
MFYAAIILGLLGSFHCVGMCGPIAFLLPLDRRSNSKKVLQLVSYHSGRLLMYSVLGALFGVLGKSLNLFGMQQQISIIIGVLMIVVIIMPTKIFNRYNFSKPLYKFVGRVKSAMGKQLKRKDPGTFFTLGYLNGLLPCGLVYMAIFGAIASQGVMEGALYMFFFGIGTIPLMTTAIYLGNFLNNNLKKLIIKAIPVLVVIVGILFILRGLGLDIPYISPSEMVAIEQVSATHSCH